MRFPESKTEPGIILGPVIGAVSHNSVRILIETNVTGTFKCSLFGRDALLKDSHKVDKEMEVVANTAQSIEITGLRPSFIYSVVFNIPFFDLAHSKFTTLPSPSDLPDANPLKIAVVSNNQVEFYEEKVAQFKEPFCVTRTVHGTRHDIWKALYERVSKDKVNMILHVGNNMMIGGEEVRANL